ncbi:MAG: hypothetical protein D6828_00190 [Nitrospirae bacterium]|nr:MAG: hypothetical protein D6828_00190 [Nitrospirota bacterium]
MVKIICKHCKKAFLVDWDEIVYDRIVVIPRGKQPQQSSLEDITLDLRCPHCGRKASYKKEDTRKV